MEKPYRFTPPGRDVVKSIIMRLLPRIIKANLPCDTPLCRANDHRRGVHGRSGCLAALENSEGFHVRWCPCKKVYS